MTPEEREEFIKRLREIKKIPKFKLSMPKFEVQMPKLEIPKFRLQKFKIPDIRLPKIEFPEIDYEKIEEITNNNSKVGWTLTDEMTLIDYLKKDMIGTTKEEKDQYFSNYYYKNDKEHFERMKNNILKNIESKWIELIDDSFESFENDKYKLVIPVLFTVIEGQMSFLFAPDKKFTKIIEIMETKAKNEEYKSKQISLYSVLNSMKDQLFGHAPFSQERKELINRHWVLHGRDNPNEWEKVDALRLFNVISSLQYIKNILKEEQ